VKTLYGYGVVEESKGRDDEQVVVNLDFDGSPYVGYLSPDAILPVSQYFNWVKGAKVTSHGLSAAKYNGLTGTILRFDEKTYRVAVRFEKLSLAIKPQNLRLWVEPEPEPEPEPAPAPAPAPASAPEPEPEPEPVQEEAKSGAQRIGAGAVVSTPYGRGVVVQDRGDGMFEVQLDFDGCKNAGFLNRDALQFKTPYGPAKILKDRDDGLFEVALDFDGTPYTGSLNAGAFLTK
jgi:hypothetical protein